MNRQAFTVFGVVIGVFLPHLLFPVLSFGLGAIYGCEGPNWSGGGGKMPVKFGAEGGVNAVFAAYMLFYFGTLGVAPLLMSVVGGVIGSLLPLLIFNDNRRSASVSTTLGSRAISPAPPSKIKAPGIALIVVGSLGLCAPLLSFLYFVTGESGGDPAAALMDGLSTVKPTTLIIRGLFVVVNILIIIGGAQMIRIASYYFAALATILAMVNVGEFCFVIGLPVGIWSLVILTQADVQAAFANAKQSCRSGPFVRP